MKITLYHADCLGVSGNCTYPNEIAVTDEKTLMQVVRHDYVCASYQDNRRSRENFLSADCLPVDCDNDHTENSAEWIHPSDIARAFPDVAFAVHYSRNHMVAKNGKAARPRFHVLFAIERVTDADTYIEMKRRVLEMFPYFDTNALDAARFFFGTSKPKVKIFDGSATLDAFLTSPLKGNCDTDDILDFIPQGKRNATMSRIAARLLKRYGDGDKAHQKYIAAAEGCTPPLDDCELATIWESARHFYQKVASQSDYISPECYNAHLKPDDYSDVGQATVLAREYALKLCYSAATDFLVYNGSFWEESKSKAQAVVQELTARQLAAIEKDKKILEQNGVKIGAKKSELSQNEQRTLQKYKAMQEYRNFVIHRRDSKAIASTLKEARPMLEIDIERLDADAFALNTPSATWDLRDGTSHPHDPMDFITKQTAVDPDEKGSAIWQDAIDTFFQNDTALEAYVQEIVGLAAIGKVYIEALIIAFGEGRNGKSTFWNTIARVLGTYAGNMSADTLTVGCRRNVKPELAEAKGKRLLIAAELEEGTRLSTSNVKQMCSTDEIYAEKKYKDPFAYTPVHTLVLYTNHLPKVGALDAGTWRRLIVIPFNAKIEGNADVKNYADYLYEQSAGAVLSWIMEGARRVIANGYHITTPEVVENALGKYRDNNDWLAHFLEDRCEIDPSYTAKSGEFYSAYRAYCASVGEWTRSTTDFYAAIESAGFERHHTARGSVIGGVSLKRTDFT